MHTSLHTCTFPARFGRNDHTTFFEEELLFIPPWSSCYDDLSAAYLQCSSGKCNYIFGTAYLGLTRWCASPITDKSSDKAVLEEQSICLVPTIHFGKVKEYHL